MRDVEVERLLQEHKELYDEGIDTYNTNLKKLF